MLRGPIGAVVVACCRPEAVTVGSHFWLPLLAPRASADSRVKAAASGVTRGAWIPPYLSTDGGKLERERVAIGMMHDGTNRVRKAMQRAPTNGHGAEAFGHATGTPAQADTSSDPRALAINRP